MPRGSFTNTNNNAGAGDFVPSEEQAAIMDAFLHTNKHLIVQAVAGSGKTKTIVECAKLDKQSKIGLTAFNKHIATELTQRMQGQSNVECMTYHSLGFRCVRDNVRHRVNVDQYKVLGYLDTLSLPVKDVQEKVAKYKIASMVGYAKTYGHDGDVSEDELHKIADRHDLDLNGLSDVVVDYTPKVLRWCAGNTHVIDFDDMVWLPYVLKLQVPRFDVLCVDEYQDTSMCQQWIAVRGGVRVVAVGDPRQAIYSFRGAVGDGFDKLRRELGKNVITLPLSLTRRCPKSHVRLAQMLVPQIHAMPDAPEGVVRETASLDAAVSEMRPGDLVVCRVNAELVGTAYKLLKRGVKAVVRGRDIGAGLIKLLDAAHKRAGMGVKIAAVIAEAGEITQEAVGKFMSMPNGRGEMRAANAQDKYGCLCELAEDAHNIEELRKVIEKLFAEFEEDGQPKNAVVLGTVHRTKGLEGNRVFVLRPDLIPHPMAKKEADVQAEMNLAYVAVTRARYDVGKTAELIFVGGPCMLFSEGQGAIEAVDAGKVAAKRSKSRGGGKDEGKQAVWVESEAVDAVPEHRKWQGR